MSITTDITERPAGLCNHVEPFGHCIVPAVTYGYCKYHVRIYAPSNVKLARTVTKTCKWLTDGQICGVGTSGRFCESHMRADIDKKRVKPKAYVDRPKTCSWLTDGKRCDVDTTGRFCEEHTQAAIAKRNANNDDVKQACSWTADGQICKRETRGRFCNEHNKQIALSKAAVSTSFKQRSGLAKEVFEIDW